MIKNIDHSSNLITLLKLQKATFLSTRMRVINSHNFLDWIWFRLPNWPVTSQFWKICD